MNYFNYNTIYTVYEYYVYKTYIDMGDVGLTSVGGRQVISLEMPDTVTVEQVYNYHGRYAFRDIGKQEIKAHFDKLAKSGYCKKIETDKYRNFYITLDFEKEFLSLNRSCGIYSFWIDNKAVYVGRSKNLGERVISSYCERFAGTQSIVPIYFKYIKTRSMADAVMLETLEILTRKPALNVRDTAQDQLTIELNHGYSWMDNNIICNQNYVIEHSN